MVQIKEDLKIISIKDESKIVKKGKGKNKEETKVTVRSVKLQGDEISIVISAEKEGHILRKLTENDLKTEANLVIDIYDLQTKITDFEKEKE